MMPTYHIFTRSDSNDQWEEYDTLVHEDLQGVADELLDHWEAHNINLVGIVRFLTEAGLGDDIQFRDEDINEASDDIITTIAQRVRLLLNDDDQAVRAFVIAICDFVCIVETIDQ